MFQRGDKVWYRRGRASPVLVAGLIVGRDMDDATGEFIFDFVEGEDIANDEKMSWGYEDQFIMRD